MLATVTHPSVLATATAAAVLAAASTQIEVPGWLWLAWGVLGVVAAAQAVRDAR